MLFPSIGNHLWPKTTLRESVKGLWPYRALCLLLTTLFILATWVFFRSSDLATAGEISAGIAGRFDVATAAAPFISFQF